MENFEKQFDSQENLGLEEQANFARAVLEAADKRNKFSDGFGGFDEFADVWQHVGDNRAQYDALAEEFNKRRAEFDEKVSDKPALVKYLRSQNEDDVAKRIISMFSLRM